MSELGTLILSSLEEINQAAIHLKTRMISSSFIQSTTDPRLFLKLNSQLPGGSYIVVLIQEFRVDQQYFL